MISIRRFLVIVIVSVVCITNFLAALQGYQDSLKEVDNIEESLLIEKANTLNALNQAESSVPSDLFGEGTLYQVWRNKNLLAKSSNAPETAFDGLDKGFHYRSYQGSQWLLYLVESKPEAISTVVGVKHRVHLSLTEEVLVKTILPIIWVLPVVGVLVWLIVVLGLRPIKGLAQQLDLREANDFSPIQKKAYAKELKPITRALDSLFLRLNDAFQREKRFSADAAHELRTPLSAIKINLHNLEREHGGGAVLDSLKHSAERMEHSIEQLLVLHRISADIGSQKCVKTDLLNTAENVIVDIYDQLSMRNQDIALEGQACEVYAMPYAIEILMRNLIDNASKYTPDMGSIKVSVGVLDNKAFVRVEDSGPGVDENEHHRLLDRFYRVGGDRHSSKIEGSGLGLSIVANILKEHNAEIRFARSDQLGGFSATVVFNGNYK